MALINTDGADRYDLDQRAGTVTVSAPATNRSSNLRVALVAPDDTASGDQQACASWGGPYRSRIQPGVVLRWSAQGDRTSAVMVTDNVWYYRRSTVNVHVFDSSRGPDRLTLVEHLDMEHGLGSIYDVRPLPWRFCARVAGSTLQVTAWSPTGDGSGNFPPWDDPLRTATVRLPATAPTTGRPGLYVGHLEAGGSTDFTDVELRPLDPSDPPVRR